MDKKINIKNILIVVAVIVAVIILIILAKIGIDKLVVSNQMKTATNAITINENVQIYKSAKESKKSNELEIGTNVYILKNITDKNGQEWYKVKTGKSVGYIKAENVKYYKKSEEKKSLMLDVSKFNLQNNFKTIGEFKAFILNNNINYVYIRAGGRGYGEAGNFYTDSNYKEYADACEYLKIPFGFYFLDEAITSDEVTEEFDFINNFIKDNNYEYNKLPVALDVEKHVETGRADSIWDTRYTLVNELIKKLEDNNMSVILYSNASIADKYLSDVEAKMWLAYYPDIEEIPDYWLSDTFADGATNEKIISKMVAWQFTDEGISGKIDAKVDLSIVYNEFFDEGSMDSINDDINEKNKNITEMFNIEDQNVDARII